MSGSDSAFAVDAASELTGRALEFRRRLTGGQHATTVLAADGSGQVVVRVFPPGDHAVLHEADVLERVRVLGDAVPQPIAHGIVGGRPTIVTSAVPGSTPDPKVPLHRIAEQLAAMLARIHRLDGSGLGEAPAVPVAGHDPLAAAARDAWSRLDLSERVLTHYDYWSGNALWTGDALAGVVDWSGARSAPRGVDVAWCRQDLVLLGSADAAEHFLHVYEQHAGVAVADVRAWDLLAAAHADPEVESWAANYHGIGRPDLTSAVLRQRLDGWVRLIRSP